MKPIEFFLRHRNALMLLAALALGALAAFGARGYIAEQLAIERERLVPRVRTTQVVVARRALERGDVVSADTMAVREVPAEYLSATAIKPDRFDGYVGARLVAPMRAGEPLLSGSLEGADPSTFSAKVREGIRAITIGVDEVNSLSGMLQPGDRIDLLLSVRMPSGASTPLAQEVTRPLMQDLRVLATGRQVRPGGDQRTARTFTAITVEVSPVQAQKLVVAQRIGKLTATLRNPQDRNPVDQKPMDVYGLLGIQRAIVEPTPRAEHPPEIIVGGQGPLKARAQGADAFASSAVPAPQTAGAGTAVVPPAMHAAEPRAPEADPRAPAADPHAPAESPSGPSGKSLPRAVDDRPPAAAVIPETPAASASAPGSDAQPAWMLPPTHLLRPGLRH